MAASTQASARIAPSLTSPQGLVQDGADDGGDQGGEIHRPADIRLVHVFLLSNFGHRLSCAGFQHGEPTVRLLRPNSYSPDQPVGTIEIRGTFRRAVTA